jgi:hypothetical protein
MSENTIITLNTVVQRNEIRFIANKLGEEMVMMNMDNGDFITLNNVGADIWELSKQPISVQDLVQKLLGIYNITPEQCTGETISFLQTSTEQSMFTIHTTN